MPSTEIPSRRFPYDVLLTYWTPVDVSVSKPWSPFPYEMLRTTSARCEELYTWIPLSWFW